MTWMNLTDIMMGKKPVTRVLPMTRLHEVQVQAKRIYSDRGRQWLPLGGYWLEGDEEVF